MSKDFTPENNQLLLEVKDLRKFFPIRNKGFLRKLIGEVRAVDDVSFFIRQGETLGLVGESGCGKTTTARCIMRAVNSTSGQILFRRPSGEIVDIASLSRKHLLPLRGEIQMIFQDPYASLNPRMNILNIIGEPLLVAGGMKDREQRIEKVSQLLRLVGLRPEYMQRFPHAFSGGQRQRLAIARAYRCRRAGFSARRFRTGASAQPDGEIAKGIQPHLPVRRP